MNKCKTCGLCDNHDDFANIHGWEWVDDAMSTQIAVCTECGIEIVLEYRDSSNENGTYICEQIFSDEYHDKSCQSHSDESDFDIKLERGKYIDIVYESFQCKHCKFNGKIRWELVDRYPSSCEVMDNINSHPDTAKCTECHLLCN